MQIIASKDNEYIKRIRKLKDKKYREIYNEYIIEGVKLVREAINEKTKIKQIIVCEECEVMEAFPKDLTYEIARYECIYVTQKIFESLTDVITPQGIIAVVEKKHQENEIDFTQDVIVALDDIQDPGNLGTILRTLDSVGLNQILVTKGTADAFNPKVVRSTMGAIFRVKVIECEDFLKTIKECRKHKFKTVVTSLQAEKTIYEINYKKKLIVIGNEAKGIEKYIEEQADEKIKIPMPGKAESLNASVATGIVLYEYIRQKTK